MPSLRHEKRCLAPVAGVDEAKIKYALVGRETRVRPDEQVSVTVTDAKG